MRAGPAPDQRLATYVDTDNMARAREFATGTPREFRPGTEPGVSVVILTLDRPHFIGPLLTQLDTESRLLSDRGLGCEVVVGDTGSTDPEVDRIFRELSPDVRVVTGLRYHFARSNNDLCQGLRHDHVLFCNNDVSLARSEGAIAAMRAEFELHPGTGAVGLAMDRTDGTVQHIGIDILREPPLRGFPYHPSAHHPATHTVGDSWPVVAATGACLMVPASLLAQVGGFDETYDSECQDVDLCLKLRRLGYGIRVVDHGPAVHVENGTRSVGEDWADRRRFMRRWRSFLEASFL